MRREIPDIMLIVGESRWDHHSVLVSSVPESTHVIYAAHAGDAMTKLLRHMPCNVTLLSPPDLSETLQAIHQMRSLLGVSVTIVDPADDELVERFSRLAGCGEYHATSPRLRAANMRAGALQVDQLRGSRFAQSRGIGGSS